MRLRSRKPFSSTAPILTAEELEPRSVPALSAATTLLQAWDIAEARARRWQSDAVLAQLSSSDVNDTPAAEAGADGRRRTWSVRASSAAGQGWLRFNVTDGVAVDVGEERGVPPLSPRIRPSIDSPAAYAAARAAEPELAGAAGKATGLHFSVGPASVSGKPRIAVGGSLRGLQAFVEIDAISGDVLGSQCWVLTHPGIRHPFTWQPCGRSSSVRR